MNIQERVILQYLAFAFGVGLTLIGVFGVFRMIGFARWRRIKGEILGSWIEEDLGPDGRIYYGRVEYTYIVGNRLYTSRRIKLVGNTSTSHSDAQEIRRRYPKGKIVDVYYNPNNPAQATLKLGQPLTPIILVFLGILFGGMAFFVTP